MIYFDKAFSNPRLVNPQGGMLVSQGSGVDIYISKDHPQYREIKDGLLGDVQEQMTDDAEPLNADPTITISELTEALKEVIEQTGATVSSGKFKEKK